MSKKQRRKSFDERLDLEEHNLEKPDDLFHFMESMTTDKEQLITLKDKLSQLVNNDSHSKLKKKIINHLDFYNDKHIDQITTNFNNLARSGKITPVICETEFTEITFKRWKLHFEYLLKMITGLSTDNFISVVSSILEILQNVDVGNVTSKFHKTTFISICLENDNDESCNLFFFALRIRKNKSSKRIFIFDKTSELLEISLCLFVANAKNEDFE